MKIHNTALSILAYALTVDYSELLPFVKACIDLANCPEHDHMHDPLPLFPVGLVHNRADLLAECFYCGVNFIINKLPSRFILL